MMLLVVFGLLFLNVVSAQNAANCGTDGPAGTKIVGGSPASYLEVPWQISLRYNSDSAGWYHTCGGTLIGPQHVLTAAHCVDGREDASKFIVRVGEQFVDKVDELEEDILVEKIVKHEQYNSQTINNDVAVLKLATSLDLAEKHSRLRTSCLADNSSPNQEGNKCIASGWGNTEWQGSGPDQLLKVTVPVVQQSTCKSAYIFVNTVTDGMICAGENGKGVCQGDSGGPLQCLVGDRWVQYGVTSWSVRCAYQNYPAVYARVSTYSDWIWQAVQNNP